MAAWAADDYLSDYYISSPSTTPNSNPSPSNGTLSFYDNPVAGPYGYIQGFGATQFAYDSCFIRPEKGCPYSKTRGLHNGLDFGVPDSTPVYWTSNVNGSVAYVSDPAFPDAGDPNNVVVDAGGYRIIFGHLSSTNVTQNATVTAGTLLGYSGHPAAGDPHLHFGIMKYTKTGAEYWNPYYFFEDAAKSSWPASNPYVAGESICSMTYFDNSNVTRWARFYWPNPKTPDNPDSDTTGIGRPE